VGMKKKMIIRRLSLDLQARWCESESVPSMDKYYKNLRGEVGLANRYTSTSKLEKCSLCKQTRLWSLKTSHK